MPGMLSYPPSFEPTPTGAAQWEQDYLDAMLSWARSVFYQPCNMGKSGSAWFQPVDRLGELSALSRQLCVIVHDTPAIRALSPDGVVVDDAFSTVWLDRDWLQEHLLKPWSGEALIYASWEAMGWVSFWVALAEAAVKRGCFPDESMGDARRYQDSQTESPFLKKLNIAQVCWNLHVAPASQLPPLRPLPFAGKTAALLPSVSETTAQQWGYQTASVRSSGLPVRQLNQGLESLLFAVVAQQGPRQKFTEEVVSQAMVFGDATTFSYVVSRSTPTPEQWHRATLSLRDASLLPFFKQVGLTAISMVKPESCHLILNLPVVTESVPWLAWAIRTRPSLAKPLFDGASAEQQQEILKILVGPLNPWRLFFEGQPDLVEKETWEAFQWLSAHVSQVEEVNVTAFAVGEIKDLGWRSPESQEIALARLAEALQCLNHKGGSLDPTAVLKQLAKQPWPAQWLDLFLPLLPPLDALEHEPAQAVMQVFVDRFCRFAPPAPPGVEGVEAWERRGWRWPDVLISAPSDFLAFARQRRSALTARDLEERLPPATVKPSSPRF